MNTLPTESPFSVAAALGDACYPGAGLALHDIMRLGECATETADAIVHELRSHAVDAWLDLRDVDAGMVRVMIGTRAVMGGRIVSDTDTEWITYANAAFVDWLVGKGPLPRDAR